MKFNRERDARRVLKQYGERDNLYALFKKKSKVSAELAETASRKAELKAELKKYYLNH